jgi:hypothetical protein
LGRGGIGPEDLQGQPFRSADEDGKGGFDGAEGEGREVRVGLLDEERESRELPQPDLPAWRPLLGEAGLPRIPFHNLRHTCATLLLSKGVHPKLV